MSEFLKLENGRYVKTTEENASSVVIDKAEYHGFLNALRIIRDRGIQQIDKSQIDENGYRLLRADKKKYHEVQNQKIDTYLITRATPYSINIPLADAYFMISQDLIKHYGLIEDRKYCYELNGLMVEGEVTDRDILIRIPSIKEKLERGEELILDEAALYEWHGKNSASFAFDIWKISSNYAQGCYEVSYYSTDFK